MAFRFSEADKMFNDSQFEQQSSSIPIGQGESGDGKPHRFTFNIGCFNDGLRSSFCKKLK